MDVRFTVPLLRMTREGVLLLFNSMSTATRLRVKKEEEE